MCYSHFCVWYRQNHSVSNETERFGGVELAGVLWSDLGVRMIVSKLMQTNRTIFHVTIRMTMICHCQLPTHQNLAHCPPCNAWQCNMQTCTSCQGGTYPQSQPLGRFMHIGLFKTLARFHARGCGAVSSGRSAHGSATADSSACNFFLHTPSSTSSTRPVV